MLENIKLIYNHILPCDTFNLISADFLIMTIKMIGIFYGFLLL